MERMRYRTVGSYPLTLTAYDEDGAQATITGTPTVSIADRLGTVIDSGTPTISSGTLTYSLAVADVPAVGQYRATWGGTVGGQPAAWVTDFEIVSGYYFEIPELRAMSRELENETTFTDDRLQDVRSQAEGDFEERARRAFVPRAAEVYLRGGDDILLLPRRDVRSVVSVTLAGVAVDVTGVEVDPTIGALRHPSSWPEGTLRVLYTHGLDNPPEGVKRAVLMLAKEYALPSALPARATVLSNDVGSYRISTADKVLGTFGLPEVDAAVARYGDGTPVVG